MRYGKADWDSLRTSLAETDWDNVLSGSADSAAEEFTKAVFLATEACVPRSKMRARKSTHPWVNETVVELVKAKHMADGTDNAKEANEETETDVVG